MCLNKSQDEISLGMKGKHLQGMMGGCSSDETTFCNSPLADIPSHSIPGIPTRV